MIIPTQETYDELQRAYEFFNQRLFESALPPCLITLQREKERMAISRMVALLVVLPAKSLMKSP